MQWITTEEAAKLLDYHPEHVRRLLRQGKLSGTKFGRTWMVEPGSVKHYEELASATRRPGPKKH